ncbi:hypothetical protein [Streptomyces sp. NPDC053048]|uniref:hypothetical protein n=1 Tax=Streptomyces sp. NPDC053048 TaxID=3365694 RepID=UPI0037CD15C7
MRIRHVLATAAVGTALALGGLAAPAQAQTVTATAPAAPSSAAGVLSYWWDTGETFNRKVACDGRGQQWKDANPNLVERWKCDWYGRSYHLLLLVKD